MGNIQLDYKYSHFLRVFNDLKLKILKVSKCYVIRDFTHIDYWSENDFRNQGEVSGLEFGLGRRRGDSGDVSGSRTIPLENQESLRSQSW